MRWRKRRMRKRKNKVTKIGTKRRERKKGEDTSLPSFVHVGFLSWLIVSVILLSFRESERNFELDEDDYELLQDNNITGINRLKPVWALCQNIYMTLIWQCISTVCFNVVFCREQPNSRGWRRQEGVMMLGKGQDFLMKTNQIETGLVGVQLKRNWSVVCLVMMKVTLLVPQLIIYLIVKWKGFRMWWFM